MCQIWHQLTNIYFRPREISKLLIYRLHTLSSDISFICVFSWCEILLSDLLGHPGVLKGEFGVRVVSCHKVVGPTLKFRLGLRTDVSGKRPVCSKIACKVVSRHWCPDRDGSWLPRQSNFLLLFIGNCTVINLKIKATFQRSHSACKIFGEQMLSGEENHIAGQLKKLDTVFINWLRLQKNV